MSLVHIHSHTPIHIHTHHYTHTHTCIYKGTHRYTHTHTHTHTCTHTYAHTHTHTYIHKRAHTHAHTQTHTCTHTHTYKKVFIKDTVVTLNKNQGSVCVSTSAPYLAAPQSLFMGNALHPDHMLQLSALVFGLTRLIKLR